MFASGKHFVVGATTAVSNFTVRMAMANVFLIARSSSNTSSVEEDECMDLPNVKLALEKAYASSTVDDGVGLDNRGGKTNVSVEGLYGAVASLGDSQLSVRTRFDFGTPVYTAAQLCTPWPAKASAAFSIGEMLGTRRSFYEYKDKPCDELYPGEHGRRDIFLCVLLEAGFAKQLVELLCTPHSPTPAKAPLELKLPNTRIFTTSTAIQYCICQVSLSLGCVAQKYRIDLLRECVQYI